METTTLPRAAEPRVTVRPVVLFLDDDANLLQAMRRTLRNQPYDIYTAKDGNEAKLILKSKPVDLIVSDEHMPGIQGTDVLGWVAREFPDVVRILLTGRPELSSALRAVNECHVYRFLTKPCKNLELAMTIRDGLEYRRLVLENRELLELTRRQLTELERSNRELDYFSRALMHDIFQPLQAVGAYCELARDENPTQLDKQTEQHLDSALARVERIVDMVAGLSEYVGLRDSTTSLEPVDLGEQVRHVLDDLAFLFSSAGGTVHLGDLPAVQGHPSRLRQLFQNLFENAIKYRSAAPPEIHVACETHEAGWTVLVSDNGIGIPQDHLARMFEAFHRAHQELQRPGSGLGLATCRRIMEQHGGTIGVESSPGAGARFRLYFPRTASTNARSSPGTSDLG